MTIKATNWRKLYFLENRHKNGKILHNKNIAILWFFFIGKNQKHLVFPIFFSPKFTHRESLEKNLNPHNTGMESKNIQNEHFQ